jgi:hypothetical protein
MVALKAFGLWLLILAFAVANGGLREGVLLKAFPRNLAFTLSGLLLIACILAIAVLSIRWLGTLAASHYLLVGLFWLALTVSFEFGFGFLLRGESFSSLLEAYKFKGGNIWPLVLAAVAIAPLAAAYARGLVAFRSSR